MNKTLLLFLSIFILGISFIKANNDGNYKSPPKTIENLILAPGTPMLRMSPDNKRYAILEYTDIPSIHEQAKEELRLAGVRVLPDTYAPKVKTTL